jgi:hypothetical protein
MQNKIVENWLTKVGELTFTIPFCQLLLSQGKRVVHISSQGPMEQGKDVIAVDRAGRVHCYQLKSGNINGRVWAGIKSEIDELVELPPKHPSLPVTVDGWDAYLVTNGTISNATSRTIRDYSEAKRAAGHQSLTTVVRGELLGDFADHFGDFLPVEISDLQWFLELYNQRGEQDLDCEKFKRYFEVFFTGHAAGSRKKRTEAVQAALILNSYLLTYKHAAGNRIEIIKAYILLLASIYQFSEMSALPERSWRETERLLYEALEVEFRSLIDDLAEHPTHYVEPEGGLLSETVTYKLRCSELLGYLSAYLSYCHLKGVEPYRSAEVGSVMDTIKAHAIIAGECVAPLLFNASLARLAKGDAQEAAKILVSLLGTILRANVPGARGLPSPYYTMTQAMEWVLNIGETRITESFQGRSFCLRSVVLLLARLGHRDILAAEWRTISYVSQLEVIPDVSTEYLSWRIAKGIQTDRFADTPQSWANLVAEATASYTDKIPPVLRDRRYFLPFWINAMPQRLNHRIMLTLCSALGEGPGTAA